MVKKNDKKTIYVVIGIMVVILYIMGQGKDEVKKEGLASSQYFTMCSNSPYRDYECSIRGLIGYCPDNSYLPPKLLKPGYIDFYYTCYSDDIKECFEDCDGDDYSDDKCFVFGANSPCEDASASTFGENDYCRYQCIVGEEYEPCEDECTLDDTDERNGDCYRCMPDDDNFGAQCNEWVSTNPEFCEGPCVDFSWTPDHDTVCLGKVFTQTSNCDTTRLQQGTKTDGCTEPVCPEGKITSGCFCEGYYSTTGYCCSEIWQSTSCSTNCNTDADTNCDGCVADNEFPSAVINWKDQTGLISDIEFPSIVINWKDQTGCGGSSSINLLGGMKLSHERESSYSSCTLGMIIERNNVAYILTAGHCVTKGSDGMPDYPDDIGLWAKHDGEIVGYVYDFDNSGAIDAALISIKSGISSEAYKDINGNNIMGFTNPSEGMDVYKIGISTGLTYGTITDTNIFYYDKNGNQIRGFEVTGDSTQFSTHGDSGAAVVTVDTPHKIVGILSVGGVACASNWGMDIKDELNID